MRYYFAPMEGVTGYLYRNTHRRFFPGTDKYFMPFITPTQAHRLTGRQLRDVSPGQNEGTPAVPQLLTRTAEDFIWAANALGELGYGQVDLNLGCPSGTVTAKGKGAGFLGDPDGLDRFLNEVFERVKTPVSIKTRLGVSEPEEFERLLAIYNQYPVLELTIHARVRADFYRGHARTDEFEKAFSRSRAPVCYNGDLTTEDDVRRLAARLPALRQVMIGRGLIADPSLVTRLTGGPRADRDTLRRFHDTLYEGYCETFGSRRNAMMRMKEFWFYHIHLFENGEKYGKKLKKAADPREFEAWTAAVYRDLPLRDDAAAGWYQT